MSDYSNQSEGVGAKGLIIAVVLIGLFIIGLAFMGGSEGPANPAATEGGAEVAPAATEAAPAVEGAVESN